MKKICDHGSLGALIVSLIFKDGANMEAGVLYAVNGVANAE